MSSLGSSANSSEALPRTPFSPDESLASDFKHLAAAISNEDDHILEDDVSTVPKVQVKRKPLPQQADSGRDEGANAGSSRQVQHASANVQHAAGSGESNVSIYRSSQGDHFAAARRGGLRQSLDSTETVSTPVVQEVKHVHKHEVRHELIHRDIHEYHEVTRILPIIEREVLPARHFIETLDGRKVEIPAPASYAAGRTEQTVRSDVVQLEQDMKHGPSPEGSGYK